MIGTKKLKKYRELVQSRIAELNRSITAAQEQARALGTRHADAMDQAATEYEKQVALHKATADRQLLQKLMRALERIRAGNFGECAECGGEIEAKRLEAIPWAQYCIKCQQALEQNL